MNMEVSERDGVMAVDDADGNGGPGRDKAVAAGEFQKEDVGIDDNDEDGDDGESARRTRRVAQWDEATHYMPPLPSRMPMP